MGELRARLDAKSDNNTLADEFPIKLHHDFGAEPYEDAQIIACCNEDYLGGCPDKELLAPHVGACLSDCAQQSCIGLHAQIEETVDALPLFVKDQGVALQNYVAGHIGDCTTALREEHECATLAVKKGSTFEEWCGHLHMIRGRWHVPNSEDWPLLEDLTFDLECEITDSSHPAEDIEVCSGVQGNNDNPPHENIDPSRPEIIDHLVGFAQADGILGSLDAEKIDGKVRVVHMRCAPDGTCPVQLRELSLRAASFSTGGFSMEGVRLELRRPAMGTKSENLIVFDRNAINAEISGTLTDNFNGETRSFSVGVENEDVSWLAVNGETLTLSSFSFNVVGHRVEVQLSSPAFFARAQEASSP